MTEFLAIAATAAGLMMAASPILQIRRMLATHSSDDFSISYMAVLLTGFGIWIAYGISLGNPVLISTNLASLGFGLLTIGVAARLRRRPQARATVDAR